MDIETFSEAAHPEDIKKGETERSSESVNFEAFAA